MHPFKKGYMSAVKDLLEKDIGRELSDKEENKLLDKYDQYNDNEKFKEWLEDFKDELYKNNVKIYASSILENIFEEEEMRVKEEAKDEMVRILSERAENIIEGVSDVMIENSRRELSEEDVQIYKERSQTDSPWYRRKMISNMEFNGGESKEPDNEDNKEMA